MGWSSASGRKEIETELRRFGVLGDDDIDLAEAALALAALDRPRVGREHYRHHLASLTEETAREAWKRPVGRLIEARVEAVNAAIYEKFRYDGDRLTYDDPQNANLMRVIDRRKGLPVALAILYIHAARTQGWVVEGLNFPGHFLVRMELAGERTIIDPFHRGRAIETPKLREMLKEQAGPDAELLPEHTIAVGNRDILLRLRNNIKIRLVNENRVEEAIETVESMLLLAPQRAEYWWEVGILHGHAENLRAAILAFENVINLAEQESLRRQAAGFIRRLHGKLN
jgi:regulator of sirC expression with transglutaminase-like and TPR domain